MKQLIIVLLSTFLLGIGCTEDDTIDNQDQQINITERPTFEELNEYMISQGHEPLSMERINRVVERMNEYKELKGTKDFKSFDCSSADPWADWTQFPTNSNCIYNSSITSITGADVAQSQDYINNFRASSTDDFADAGFAYDGYSACSSTNFAVISYYELGVGETTVDSTDQDIAVAFILGLCS